MINDNHNETDSLKLYSKTKAASILGIGKAKLEKLLSSRQLTFLFVDGKMRIPRRSIEDFINRGIENADYPSVQYDLSAFDTMRPGFRGLRKDEIYN